MIPPLSLSMMKSGVLQSGRCSILMASTRAWTSSSQNLSGITTQWERLAEVGRDAPDSRYRLGGRRRSPYTQVWLLMSNTHHSFLSNRYLLSSGHLKQRVREGSRVHSRSGDQNSFLYIIVRLYIMVEVFVSIQTLPRSAYELRHSVRCFASYLSRTIDCDHQTQSKAARIPAPIYFSKVSIHQKKRRRGKKKKGGGGIILP